MECKYCKSKWHTEPETTSSFCPFCGEDLRTDKQKKEDKKGFDYTWGLLHEDTLKKNPNTKNTALRDLALDSYRKAAASKPDDAVHAAAFLQRYPWSSQGLQQILQQSNEPAGLIQSLGEVQEADRAALQILLEAAVSGSERSALRFLFCLDQICKTADIPDSQTEPLLSAAASGIHNHPLVLAQIQRMQGCYQQAAQELCTGLKTERLILDDPDLFFAWSGLAKNPEDRISQLQQALTKQDAEMKMRSILNALYHPLSQAGHEFDHLNEAISLVTSDLDDHQQLFTDLTRKMLERRENLRGIHLCLQQLKNQGVLTSQIEDLLNLHYEKVYMVPYEKIQETDYILDPEFL